MSNYEYPQGSFRARCVKVVDGDTADLYVDTGFHGFKQERFRFYGINAPELRGPKDKDKREIAKEAKAFVIDTIAAHKPDEWPLRIETEKDPDHFGRYICRIFYQEDGQEVCLNDKLVELGLAVYKNYK